MRKLFYELSDERFNRESGVEDSSDGEATSSPKAQKIKRIKAHTVGQMLQLIKAPGDYATKFKEQVASLAEKGIFIRGSNLTCTHCGLTTWYRINELAESIKCKGCFRGFQMPIDKKVEFAYQFNPLFFEGFSQGVSCVLLTALLLEGLCDHSMMWQSGCMIKKDGKNTEAEYDLVAMCDGLLVVAECKTFFDNGTVKDKVLPQLQRDIEFAERIHADIFLFATQKEDTSTEIVDFLREQNANRTRLHVRLVTSTELYQGALLGEDGTPREKITSLFQLVKRFPPYLPGLSEIDPKGIGGTMAY
jgi:Holliday junction resolvase